MFVEFDDRVMKMGLYRSPTANLYVVSRKFSPAVGIDTPFDRYGTMLLCIAHSPVVSANVLVSE
jgi:hypothetical protein